ncbi:MAG: hypothetical protein V1872_14510 [bacterium]
MTKQQLLQELEALASRMNIDIRYERGNIKGGLCRIHEKQLVIINKQFSLEDKIDIFIQSLQGFPLEEIYVSPQLRTLLTKRLKTSAK